MTLPGKSLGLQMGTMGQTFLMGNLLRSGHFDGYTGREIIWLFLLRRSYL